MTRVVLKYSKWFFLVLIIAVNISCDQITKSEVRQHVELHEIIEIVDSKFVLTHVENTGAALSLGSSLSPPLRTIFLKNLPIFLMIALIAFVIRQTRISGVRLFAFACIIGGGIGNLFDRWLFDSVTDFMFLDIGLFQTGIFNMADVSITMGCILILFSPLIEKIHSKFSN